jgi:cytochrome c553
MAQVAKRLSGSDIGALAAWLSSQPVPSPSKAAATAPVPAPLDCGSGLAGPR